MAYHLCGNDHYVNGKEGAYCPVSTCQSKLGPGISREEPDPRGEDPFYEGKTRRAPTSAVFRNAAECQHFLCGEVLPNIKAFQAHLPTCSALDRGEKNRYRQAVARA